MAKVSLSKDFVSDSESDSSEDENINLDFVPPSDYKKVSHLKKFKTAKGDNEEVWLLNFPSNVDLSSLKTLSVPESTNDEAIIKLNKKKYSVSRAKNSDEFSNLQLLIPTEDRESLSISPNFKKFDKVFTISENTSIPDIKLEEVKVPRKDCLLYTS